MAPFVVGSAFKMRGIDERCSACGAAPGEDCRLGGPLLGMTAGAVTAHFNPIDPTSQPVALPTFGFGALARRSRLLRTSNDMSMGDATEEDVAQVIVEMGKAQRERVLARVAELEQLRRSAWHKSTGGAPYPEDKP